MEGLSDAFTSQRLRESIMLGEESEVEMICCDQLAAKEHIGSVAGDLAEKMWLNETQTLYSGSGYQNLLAGNSWQDGNLLDDYLMLTSQTHRMELLDLQLQENQKHITRMEGNRTSSYVEASEGQPCTDQAGILSNGHSGNFMSQNQSIQSSSCTTDIACRTAPLPGQYFFPRRHSLDLQNTGISLHEDSVDGRSLDLHYKSIQKNGSKGGPRRQWSPEEDRKLKELVEKYGQQRWSHIATFLQARKGKQCRERWLNHLRSNIKRDEWTEKEEELLISLHDKYENRWAEIAKHMPGRPENAIKNHWNATKRRRDLRNIKPRKGSSDCLETVQRSMVLRNYLQRHLIEDNTTSSKKSKGPANSSANISAHMHELESAQETVDSSATVSYQKETSQLDLCCTQESDSFNVEAVLRGTYKPARYEDLAPSNFSYQSSVLENAFVQDSTFLQSDNSHISASSEFSPFSTQEISLLEYGSTNVGANSQNTPLERTLWDCGMTDVDRLEGEYQDCWGHNSKFTNAFHTLVGSHGSAVQNRPFSQSNCCPPALISCEEDVALAFQGNNLSVNNLYRDTYASIRDWFASSPLSEVVKSCRDEYSSIRPMEKGVTRKTANRHLQFNLKSNQLPDSHRDYDSLLDQKTNQRDIAPLLNDPVQRELPHGSLSTVRAVYPSQHLSTVPESQEFQIILEETEYAYSSQPQEAIRTEQYSNRKSMSSMSHDYMPIEDQLYDNEPERRSPLSHYHSAMDTDQWTRSESLKQISDELMDGNKQELDLIELVTLS